MTHILSVLIWGQTVYKGDKSHPQQTKSLKCFPFHSYHVITHVVKSAMKVNASPLTSVRRKYTFDVNVVDRSVMLCVKIGRVSRPS